MKTFFKPTLLTLASFASLHAGARHIDVQSNITGVATSDCFGEVERRELSIDLPRDGSSCDPKVISQNLHTLQDKDVLEVTNLTLTKPEYAVTNCYGFRRTPLLKEALEKHCQKAQALADIVSMLQE